MSDQERSGGGEGRIKAIVAAHAVLNTVSHILSVSTDLADARRQVESLQALVMDRAQEESVPDAMLREAGRDALMELL
jgi:phage/plasmid primase-like uncharacterized protein